MSSLLNSLDTIGENVQYDTHVKRVLSDKGILSWITKGVAKEFKDCTVEDIRNRYIGDDVQISEVLVYPGMTNSVPKKVPKRILGENTEDNVPWEGKVYFDIRFHAWIPQKDSSEKTQKVKILLNIEAQKSFYPGYEIVTRGIFYAARMISAQFDTEFAADDYDEIKKVYSIWLCMNTPLYMGNGISVYQMSKNDLIAGIKDRPQAYDKLAVVLIAVNDQIEDSTGSEAYDRMSRLLKVVLSAELSLEEKKDILESEYELEMESKTEGELGKMCNLAEGIEERGIQKGIQKGIQVLIEAYKEMNLDRKTAAEQVGQKYNLTEEKIAEVMERYWGE